MRQPPTGQELQAEAVNGIPPLPFETNVDILAETVSETSGAPALKIAGKVLARNPLLNLAGQVIPLLAGFATMSYVVRHLGPDHFGLLSRPASGAWDIGAYRYLAAPLNLAAQPH